MWSFFKRIDLSKPAVKPRTRLVLEWLESRDNPSSLDGDDPPLDPTPGSPPAQYTDPGAGTGSNNPGTPGTPPPVDPGTTPPPLDPGITPPPPGGGTNPPPVVIVPPPLANLAPRIINFSASQIVAGSWELSGDVVDEAPGALTIAFGGVDERPKRKRHLVSVSEEHLLLVKACWISAFASPFAAKAVVGRDR